MIVSDRLPLRSEAHTDFHLGNSQYWHVYGTA